MNTVEYKYCDKEMTWANNYIWPFLKKLIAELSISDKRVFEVGCGNGAIANNLSKIGFEVTGIDESSSGIEIANNAYPHLKLYCKTAYQELSKEFGKFPLVISLEVLEHCMYPRQLISTISGLLQEDGIAIISTPYHGYWKNLAMAIFNKWDSHHDPLWDGGHIKFFSVNTLTRLLNDAGFNNVNLYYVGRIPPFSKSMIAVIRK